MGQTPSQIIKEILSLRQRYAGKQFANSEQYMMYHKVMMFGKKDLAAQIMQTSDPMKCKKIGRMLTNG